MSCACADSNGCTSSSCTKNSGKSIRTRDVVKTYQPFLSPSSSSNIIQELQHQLPFLWFSVPEENGINVLMLSRGLEKSIQRRTFFSFSGEEVITVHRKLIGGTVKQCILDQSGLDCNINDGNVAVTVFVQRIVTVVERFRSYEICVGVNDPEYKRLWSSDTSGEIDKNIYEEIRYTETFRPGTCELLVPTTKYLRRRCSVCNKIRKKFNAKLMMHIDSDATSSTPNSHMSRDQLLNKVQIQQKKLKYRQSEIWRLKSKLRHALSNLSVSDIVSEQIMNICLTKLDNE